MAEYQDYPRHVHKAGGAFKEVGTDTARDAAVAEGWSLTPVLDEPAAVAEFAVAEPAPEALPKKSRGKKGAPTEPAPEAPPTA